MNKKTTTDETPNLSESMNENPGGIHTQQITNKMEQRYRTILESQNSMVVRIDRKGCFTYANPAYCQMFGKSLDELVGKPFTPFVHPDDLPAALENLKNLDQPPYRIAVEERVLTVNGLRWFSWEDYAILDESNHYDEIQGIGHDITDQKKAEELAILLAQRSTLAEALPICLELALHVSGMDCGGIYMVDHQTGDLNLMQHQGLSDDFVSNASHYHKGSDRYQLVMKGAPIFQQYLQTDVPKNSAQMNEGLRSFASIPIHFDGGVIACINIASHTKDEIIDNRRNELEKLALQLGNMISRVQVQDALVESQNQLQSMFDSLMDFVFVLDQEGKILQVNRMVLKRLGYERDEIIGKSVLVVHPPAQREKAWEIVGDMLAGRVDTCPLDLLKKDGACIPVETRVAPGRWGSQNVIIGVSRDITERKAADDRLQEKVKEIEGFFSVSLDLLCITDLQGNIIRVNEAWETTLGYPSAELEKKNLLDIVYFDDIEETRKEIINLKQGQQIFNFVNRCYGRDGSWHYLEWRTQSRGNLAYSAARDITDRKMADNIRSKQTELLAYRNQFEEILTSISTRFINMPSTEIDEGINQALKQIGELEQVDRSYVFLLNDQASEMSNTHEWCAPGIEPEIKLLQNLPTQLFPWWMEKLKHLEEVYIPVVSEMPPEAQSEREILEEQGTKSVLVVPMVMNKKLIGFLGFDTVINQRYWSPDSILLIKMVADILSNTFMRVQMESDLRQSEARNSALLGAIPDPIFRIQRDGTLIDYTVSNPEILAMPVEKIIGASLKVLLDEPTFLKALVSIEKALESSIVQTLEYNLKVGSSVHIFEARFKNSGADEVIAIIRDISERARLEQMKSDFINRATHELRTPIATMLLMVSLIDSDHTSEEFGEYWDVMKSEINREKLLVEDLLSAGRLETDRDSFNIRPVDISLIIHDTLQLLDHNARDKEIRVDIQSHLDAENAPHTVQGDETALTQVLVNLVGNAIKFTPNGGRVVIDLKKEGDGIGLSIIDTGIGIPAEDMPLLFGRFFRGRNAVENEIQGTGIGLFIVRSIVEKHGGTIRVASGLGKGSKFDIWLPAKKGSSQAIRTQNLEDEL